MADVLHYLRINASPERVYEALTTPEGVRGWWTREVDLDSEVDGRGSFRFGKLETVVRIEALEPGRRVTWTPIQSDAPGGWVDTTIDFGLERDGEQTIVRFAHRGYAQADDGYAIVTTGWAWYLMSLKALVETGRGAPHPEKAFVI
jgi:uncharacterized protein YndB with AHSA1/START domain